MIILRRHILWRTNVITLISLNKCERCFFLKSKDGAVAAQSSSSEQLAIND